MRKAKGVLSIVAGLVLLFQAGSSIAYADDGRHKVAAKSDNKASHTSTSPAGNNGDIKIHDADTAQDDHSNEPKVCRFYIDGFNFDSRSSGQWKIEGQGQTSGSFGSGTWGPSDSDGNWRSGVMTLPDGHYKAFAWQTMANGVPNDPPGGEKTKVFKVDCTPAATGNSGEEAKGQISAAITTATSLNAALTAKISDALALLASCTTLLTSAQAGALQADITATSEASAKLTLKLTAAQTALTNLNTAIASGNAASIAAAVTAATEAATALNASASDATQGKANLSTEMSGLASVCGNTGGNGNGNGGGNGNGNGNSGEQSNVGAQAQAVLEAAINAAEKAAAQLAVSVAAAQQILHSGTLNVTQELALNATVQAALAAQTELAARLAAAQNALAALNTAINSGSAAEIAAAASAAEQAAANLGTAANAATQANTNLNTTTNELGLTSATTTAVNGVQTAPTTGTTQTTQTGAQSTTTSQTVVGGVQTLPSTSTESNIPLTALGGVLLSIGVWLLRKPTRDIG
jgi:LPXTG-motif cell wall-anchored protein